MWPLLFLYREVDCHDPSHSLCQSQGCIIIRSLFPVGKIMNIGDRKAGRQWMCVLPNLIYMIKSYFCSVLPDLSLVWVCGMLCGEQTQNGKSILPLASCGTTASHPVLLSSHLQNGNGACAHWEEQGRDWRTQESQPRVWHGLSIQIHYIHGLITIQCGRQLLSPQIIVWAFSLTECSIPLQERNSNLELLIC